MYVIPKLFSEYTTEPFQEKLKSLSDTYSGIVIGKKEQQRSLVDELEFQLELAVLKHKRRSKSLLSQASLVSKIELYMLDAMKQCSFSYIKVIADDREWNPIEQSFEEFKMNNLMAEKFSVTQEYVISTSVKDVFEKG